MKNKKLMTVADAGRRGGKAALTKMTAEERSARARKGAAARWPQKIHTLKKPCTFPECKVTVNHEHL
jgi:hypothetical protein